MPTRTPDAEPDDDLSAIAGPDGDEGPASPGIPSLASLRSPRRRSAVDLLVPPRPAPAPAQPAPSHAAAQPTAGSARPPEWVDLWHLGVHVGRSLAGVPAQVVRWQVRCLRTLLDR